MGRVRYDVSVRLPGESNKSVGTFKTKEEAQRCAEQWRNDYRLPGRVVTIVEVAE